LINNFLINKSAGSFKVIRNYNNFPIDIFIKFYFIYDIIILVLGFKNPIVTARNLQNDKYV